MIPQFSYGGRQCRFLYGQAVGKYCPVQFCDAFRHSDAFQSRAVIEAVLSDRSHPVNVDLLQCCGADKAPVRQRGTALRHGVAGFRLCLRIAEQRFSVCGKQHAVLLLICRIFRCNGKCRQCLTAVKHIISQRGAGGRQGNGFQHLTVLERIVPDADNALGQGHFL